MIHNEEELARALQRLELIKDELAIVRYNVLPQNRRTHDLMIEYFMQRIDAVQAEIDAYLASRGTPAASADEGYGDRLEEAYGDRGQS